MAKVIFDLDDYCNKYNCFDELLKLKKEIPNLKVTLFTIPGRIKLQLLEDTKFQDWIQLAVHGIYHDSNFEFAKKSYAEAYYQLWKSHDPFFYVKGFKAPGWQISTQTMRVLKDLGWWVAVQYSDGRYNGHPDGPHQPPIPEGLSYYACNELPDDVISIHGHTWDTCGNSIKDLKPELMKYKDCEFEFIDNFIKK